MPPYWDNKALSTPTRYFIFNFLIISFILLKIKAFAIWVDLKMEKNNSAKGGFELGSVASKSIRVTIYATETDVGWASFCSLDSPNHTLVGGVSINSLCQQGGPFALSVNRHSQKGNRTSRCVNHIYTLPPKLSSVIKNSGLIFCVSAHP